MRLHACAPASRRPCLLALALILQLGGAGCTESPEPTDPALPDDTADLRLGLESVPLSAGVGSTCALGVDDLQYCWGHGSIEPTPVSDSLQFSSVSIGGVQTCGLPFDRRAFCFGRNDSGSLGTGTTNSATDPTPVRGGHEFVRLNGGSAHTWGLVSSGRLYCWGSSASGELGAPSADRCVNTKVYYDCALSPQASLEHSPSAEVRAGQSFTCTLGADGRVACFGEDSFGQTATAGVPVLRQLTAGGYHACGISLGNEAYCWGAHDRLGDGPAAACTHASCDGEARKVTGDLSFAALSAGGVHTCGLTLQGRAYCWGQNVRGQLGDGTLVSKNRPVAVSGGLTFIRLSAGSSHTCGLTPDGTIYCWGANEFRQLGAPAVDHSSLPLPVRSPVTFRAQ